MTRIVAEDTSESSRTTGDVRVIQGAHFRLSGMVIGSLIVEGGAQATVSGMVQGIHVLPGGTVSLQGTCTGSIKNEGRLIVAGTVQGHIQSAPDAETVLEDGARVSRGW